MKRFFLFLIFFTLSFSLPQRVFDFLKEKPENGENWVIIIAGGSGDENYFSQASSCHAYQEMVRNGVDKDHIIHWLYDDAATSKDNPYPGHIYQYEGGEDVYKNVGKDLTGDDVTIDNFKKLMRGDDMSGLGSGKTLKSGPNDRIFFYYNDHGGELGVYFPRYTVLFAPDLKKILQGMFEKKMYKEMLIYFDCCNSGSMFHNYLPDNWNIYAMASADPKNPGYQCYCYEILKYRCTGSYWGENWMKDSAESRTNQTFQKRTLLEQFEIIKEKTYIETDKKQTSCDYGDKDIQNRTLNQFQGNGNSIIHEPQTLNKLNSQGIISKASEARWNGLKRAFQQTNSKEDKIKLIEYEKMMKRNDLLWDSFSDHFSVEKITDETPSNDYNDCYPKELINIEETMDCHRETFKGFVEICGNFNEYSYKYGSYLSRACRKGIESKDILSFFEQICPFIN